MSGCSVLDGVMALSISQKEQIIKTYGLSPEIIFLIGTGYNEKIFYNGIKPALSGIDIVYAGKLSRAKGVIWLLKALNKINHFNWHLHMAGSGAGPEHDEVLKEAEEMKGKVTWYGQVRQKELAILMRKCHIFVLPSFYEGFPLVLIEALSSGCRIVVTELPAVMEMTCAKSLPFISTVPLPRLDGPDRPVEEDLPLFVENLKKSLEEQLCLSGEKLPDEEITSLLKYYTWTEVFKKIENVYIKVIKNSNCAVNSR
jgi:glycosyltransferase involved in cell wall biosynthesis